MDHNPYQSPEFTTSSHPFGENPDEVSARIYSIAVSQKAINVCVLVNFSLIALQLFSLSVPQVAFPAFLGLVVMAFVSLIFAFLLAQALHGTVQAVLYALFMLIPYLNLLLLLGLNNRATKKLEGFGIRVGLLGANLKEVRNACEEGLEPVIATPRDFGELQTIRRCRSVLIIAYLAGLLLGIAAVVLAFQGKERLVASASGPVLLIWYVYFVLGCFALAISLKGKLRGFILGLLAVTPGVGLFVGLYILSAASTELDNQEIHAIVS